jgi:hypothetical protein
MVISVIEVFVSVFGAMGVPIYILNILSPEPLFLPPCQYGFRVVSTVNTT